MYTIQNEGVTNYVFLRPSNIEPKWIDYKKREELIKIEERIVILLYRSLKMCVRVWVFHDVFSSFVTLNQTEQFKFVYKF